jgi:hypothetical protein
MITVTELAGYLLDLTQYVNSTGAVIAGSGDRRC